MMSSNVNIHGNKNKPCQIYVIDKTIDNVNYPGRIFVTGVRITYCGRTGFENAAISFIGNTKILDSN